MCIDSSIDIIIDYSNSVSTDFCFAITKDSSDSLTTDFRTYIITNMSNGKNTISKTYYKTDFNYSETKKFMMILQLILLMLKILNLILIV